MSHRADPMRGSILRQYDQAVVDILTLKSRGEAIPIVMATPRREYGNRREQHPDIDEPERQQQTVHLPSMAVGRYDVRPSETRRRLARHRKIRYSDDLNTVGASLPPIAVDISYQLDIWTRLRDDANVILTWTMSKFPRVHRWVTVDMGWPWGEKRVAIRYDGASDNTDLEPGTEGDREVRMTLDLVMEGWIPVEPEEIRTVRRSVVQLDLEFHDGGLDQTVFKETLEEA